MSKKKEGLSKEQKKIINPVLAILLVPILVLGFVFFQANLLNIILKAKPEQASKNLNLPIDINNLPYSNSKTRTTSKQFGVFEHLDNKNLPDKIMENTSKTAENMVDSKLYGAPYSWKDNKTSTLSG